jgi:hypothetical protein
LHKFTAMKKFLRLLLVLLVIFGVYWFFFRQKKDRGPRQQPLTVKKHSQPFNQSINDALNSYFDLQTSFVDADTNGIKIHAAKFMTLLDSIQIQELKKDTAGIFESAQLQIGDIKANTNSILMQTDLTEMRKDYRMVSEALYPFLKTVRYEGPILYWHNCGMPFGENTTANWISKTYEIVNPYLGKNHPVYKSGMLRCGVVQDSIYAK